MKKKKKIKKEIIRDPKESSFAYMQRLKRAGLTIGSGTINAARG